MGLTLLCFLIVQTITGEMPLHFACSKKWPVAAKQLVFAGADMLSINDTGFTPFLFAVVEGFY